MSKQARCVSATGIYHVMLRGVNKQLIFEEPTDYEQLLSYLAETKEYIRYKLLAYCLMGNHIHLLVKEDGASVSQVVQRLASRYATWFNRKYDRCGPLFQGRFRSEAIESDSYFITVLIYIYQNPVRAGLCACSTDYRWSSREFLGGGDGIVDEGCLFELAPMEMIKDKESTEISEQPIEIASNDRRHISDEQVISRLKIVSGSQNIADFQKLEQALQASALNELHRQGASFRQLARISGLGKSLVERRCRYVYR